MKVQRRIFSIVWVIYFTLCLLAFIWPIATVANRVEPKIFDLPPLFAWNIAIVGLIFIGCVAMYLWDMALGKKEHSNA